MSKYYYNIIRTDTDNSVNVLSTIKKKTKNPALLKLPTYFTELAAVKVLC